MPKYTILTSSICISRYKVEANSAKQAEELLYEVEDNEEEFIDFKDEVIISVIEEK